MDKLSIPIIADRLEQLNIALDREAMSMARWIWTDILGLNSSEEILMSGDIQSRFEATIVRLENGEPIQYIAGHAWFYGLRFDVNPAVLIPRPETEELVEWILQDCKKRLHQKVRILDIGTGSGCIAITLKKKLGDHAEVVAIDNSKEALIVAASNAGRLGQSIVWLERDVLAEELTDLGRFDIIVSNPPYISKDLAGQNIIQGLIYEPQEALYPRGADPDIFYKKFSLFPDQLFNDGATCYFELNEFRVREIEAYFERPVWTNREVRIDMQGMPRMLKVYR